MNRTAGRIQVRNLWRPAYIAESGDMYVSPAMDLGWRAPTALERKTWQARIPAEQGTVGRIGDDTLYVTQ